MVRKRKQRKGRASEQSVDRRGRQIYEKDNQIKPLTGQRRDVASQSEEGVSYMVSLGCGRATCVCPYHVTGKGCRCKHIAAVEYMPFQETESSATGRLIIGEAELKCPGCKKKNHVRNGKDESGKQRYLCKECGHRFRNNLGFEYHHTPPLFITLAFMLNGMEMSPHAIRIVLGHMGVSVHVDTISRWLAHYVALVERYTDPMRPPNLGSKLGADEKRQDIRGEESHLVMAMDLATRFISAWETTADKMGHDATKLLEAAKAKAGKPYPILITDGLSGYYAAFKRVFGALKGLFIHLCDIHIRNKFSNTNGQERVNSTFAGRARLARGINSENSPVYRIFILHHIYIRPHGGIGGRTPAEAAGIEIRGRNKWLTLIQNAEAAA